MAQNLFRLVHRVFTDGGALEPNATIEVFDAGLATPRTLYSDRALTLTAGSSVTADARGVVPERWIADGIKIKLVYKDSLGAVKDTRDYVNDDDDPSEAFPWADLASAATTDLGAADSENVRVTGAVTITSFGVAADGLERMLRFAGAPLITHHATALILPGGMGHQVAAGDTMGVRSLGFGNWICTSYAPMNRQMGTAAAPIPTHSTAGAGGCGVTAYYDSTGAAADAVNVAFTAAAHLSAGERQIAVAMLARAFCDTTWGPGGSAEAGCVAVFADATSTRGGAIFAGGFHTLLNTTAGGVSNVLELDGVVTGVTALQKRDLIILSPAADDGAATQTVTIDGTANTALLSAYASFGRISGGGGRAFGILSVQGSSGVTPITVALWRQGGSTAVPVGLDWRDQSFSTAAGLFKNASPLSWRNAAADATFNGIVLNSSNIFDFAAAKLKVDPSTGRVTTFEYIINQADENGLSLKDAAGNARGLVGLSSSTLGNVTDMMLYSNGGDWCVGAVLRPIADNSNSLGKTGKRWTEVFAATGTINTSDQKEKTELQPVPDSLRLAIRSLFANDIGVFQWLDAIGRKGPDKARLHIGTTVQRVIAAFKEAGEDPFRWGVICADPLVETIKTDRPVLKRVKRAAMVPGLVPDIREFEQEETHHDDKVEMRIRGHAAAVRKQAGLPPLADDGWRPRTNTVVATEHIHDDELVVDDDGNPVMVEVSVRDDTGRVVVENGRTKTTLRQKVRHVPRMKPGMVEGEIEEEVHACAADGEPLYEAENVPVIDPATGEQMIRYGLREGQLFYLALASLVG